MISLCHHVCRQVSNKLSTYDKSEMLAAAAGLLTAPQFSANAVRIETLVHLSILSCNGKRKVTRTLFRQTLNEIMGDTYIAMVEDPIEDVFVSNILTSHGDLRIFNALREGNDYFVQTLIDIIDNNELPISLRLAAKSCIELLRVSEEIAQRAGLDRNCHAESHDKLEIKIPTQTELLQRSRFVTFTEEDLTKIDVDRELLQPFILKNSGFLRNEVLGNTTLERYPIVLIENKYIVALPSSIGVAIRRYFLNECQKNEELNSFSRILSSYQTHQLKHIILREFTEDAKIIKPNISVIDNLPPLDSFLLKDKNGFFLHVVVFHDDLSEIIKSGVDSNHEPNKEEIESISIFFDKVSKYSTQQGDYRFGATLCSHGGLGRGHSLALPKFSKGWLFAAVSLSDLLIIAESTASPLQDFFLCMKQKAWAEEKGVEILNANGDINYFGYWLDNEHQCLPKELPIAENTKLSLYTDFVFLVRRNLRIETDKHCVKYVDGNYVKVERLTKNSFFKGMKNRPVYVSTDHLESGFLTAVIESDFANIWFGISERSDNIPNGTVFEWWSGFVGLLSEILILADESSSINSDVNIQVLLDFSRIEESDIESVKSPNERNVDVYRNNNTAVIKFEPNYLANFSQEENYGERLFLGTVLEIIEIFMSEENIDISMNLKRPYEKVLMDPGVRVIHMFSSFGHVDYLLSALSRKPKFSNKQMATFERIRASQALGISDTTFEGDKECKKVLNDLVDVIWNNLKNLLKKYNKLAILLELSNWLNDIEQDRSQWRNTSRAISSIHGSTNNVVQIANERESLRSLTGMSIRGLIEICVCECVNKGGLLPTKQETEQIVSLISVLISVASDSDAIHWGLVNPAIKVYPNGIYEIEADIFSDVIHPYLTGHFDRKFRESSESYGELYIEKGKPERQSIEDKYKEEFVKAFVAETGLSLDVVFDIIAEITDCIYETNKLCLVIAVDDFSETLQKNRKVDRSSLIKFIDQFAIKYRPSWDKPPKGYNFRDIAPWKHKRRLSSLTRPILMLDDNTLLFNLLLVRQGISYFFRKAHDGEFNTEFFFSEEMRSYIGSTLDSKGAEFTSSVASELKSLGWKVKQEVLMTKLGARQDLGDADILALKRGKLLVIECKHLQMAKTVSEIGDICNRFKGDAKDELAKHINRVSWISKNVEVLNSRKIFDDSINEIGHYLVTSTEMPMHYREDLPVDRGTIISFDELKVII